MTDTDDTRTPDADAGHSASGHSASGHSASGPFGAGAVPAAADISALPVTHDHLLSGAVPLVQPKDGYRVGTDAILLAASIGTAKGRILDMGAGVGGVCLCLAHRLPAVQITAIEKDPAMAALAARNIGTNDRADQIRLITGDITTMPPVLAGSFDHVVSNPPYHDTRGTRPRNRARALAHMGEDTTLEQWVKAALWAVKPRGTVSFICRADRMSELITLFESNGAGETLVMPIWPRPDVPAGRVIVQVRRDIDGPGALLSGLVIHLDSGAYTAPTQAIMQGGPLPMVHPARRKPPSQPRQRPASPPPTTKP